MSERNEAGEAQPGLRFTLYGRSWCHLCEDMLAALQACMARLGRPYAVEVVDIDTDAGAALLARYDELVPVLVDAEGQELCHYFLDDAAVAHYAEARWARSVHPTVD